MIPALQPTCTTCHYSAPDLELTGGYCSDCSIPPRLAALSTRTDAIAARCDGPMLRCLRGLEASAAAVLRDTDYVAADRATASLETMLSSAEATILGRERGSLGRCIDALHRSILGAARDQRRRAAPSQWLPPQIRDALGCLTAAWGCIALSRTRPAQAADWIESAHEELRDARQLMADLI